MAVSIDNCDTGPYKAGEEVTLTGTCSNFNDVTFTVTMSGNPVEHTTEAGQDGDTWTCVITMPACPPGATGNQEVHFLVEEGESSDICVLGLICP